MAEPHILASGVYVLAYLDKGEVEIGDGYGSADFVVLAPEDARKLATTLIPAALAELEKHRNGR